MKKFWQRNFSFRHSLLSPYLLIILFAFLFIPIIFPLASVIYMIIDTNTDSHNRDYLKYGNSASLESMWHKEAAQLSEKQPDQIDRRLQELKHSYPEGNFFWVDASGATRLQLPEQNELPAQWSPADALKFMKQHVGGDPFTVVSFFGEDHSETGFMVFQLPRSLLKLNTPIGSGTPFYLGFIFLMFVLFILISLLFVRNIRKRLLRLQAAMTLHGDNGLPLPIQQTKQDEIGQLERAFNQMIGQLHESKEREQTEEKLRKQLIANLSHDLRTPLTVMNSHIYSLRSEALSDRGEAAVRQLEHKITNVSSLIDNLLSYTLMTSGRYPLKLEQLDILRLVRESAAAWYPLWEKEGIEPEILLPEEPLLWHIDKEGFRRILDNLFQNIVRHAGSGQYIGISIEDYRGQTALIIRDRGAGLGSQANDKGAGIGLAIVEHLIREMGLNWHKDSSPGGTHIYIYPPLPASHF